MGQPCLAACFIFALFIYLAALRLEVKALCRPQATTQAKTLGMSLLRVLSIFGMKNKAFAVRKLTNIADNPRRRSEGQSRGECPLLHENKVSTGDKEGMVFLSLALLEVSHSHRINISTVNTITT